MVDEQNSAPGPDDSEMNEDAKSERQNGRVDGEDDSPVRNYRVLGQHNIIDGERYSDADDEGGYGQVELSDRYAKQLMERDIRLFCLGPFEDGEDALNYGEKYDPQFGKDSDAAA